MSQTTAPTQDTEEPDATTEGVAPPIAPDDDETPQSFAKGLFVGELRQDLVSPFPGPSDAEREQVRELLSQLHAITDELHDPHQAEEDRALRPALLQALGEAGFLGLYLEEELGGLGLSQTGYCRVSEEFGRIDPTLAVVLGVHQSIGYKPIAMFGTAQQRERWLPDLAAGRRLAGFALTEPTTGSDAWDLQTRAERRADGSWVLNGEKRWIGNGNRDVVCVFARSEEHGHVCLVVDGGPDDNPGFSSPHRYDTMGLRANDLRHLRFDDVVVPGDQLIGQPGDGFRIAVEVLNNGRMSLGTGSVGAVKHMLALATEHVCERQQFGQRLADFELVQEKLGWMAVQLYGLESLAYMTTGLVDRGVQDTSLESAMIKVAGTEFLWYGANRAFQLAGGEAYQRTGPYEKILRDIRIFPIFEGANDVLKAFVALQGLKGLSSQLEGLGHLDLRSPVTSAGLMLEYVVDRVRREVAPDRLDGIHDGLRPLADPLEEQVAGLRRTSERLLRRHGEGVVTRQLAQERLAETATDICAQVATITRLSERIERLGEAAGTERFIGETFVRRAANRVGESLRRVDDNDDERILQIARSVADTGGYGQAYM